MAQQYEHKKIEEKWKPKWFENELYRAENFSKKPKKYILAELPYPSGDYLHVGHMMRYTVPEIYSRYLRMQGFNVLYPMGWDSFGLPAETNAIKTGRTPQQVIKEATPNFKKSMQDMGYAIDWSREIDTSNPSFYKWTQWMFIKMWEKGLVEQQEMPVWWCEELGVLADEEVLPDDKSPTGKKSERDGHIVYRKNLKQWVLKITDYADRLLEDLDKVDYTDAIKTGQTNWIGKKTGMEIQYKVENEKDVISCFTTRPDTNFGATFIVLAPEHEFSEKVGSENPEAAKYIKEALAKSDMERIEERGTKTGVFTGYYAINQLNGARLPIWISDFVLGGYGTGAVVGVPGHDERDYAFAKEFGLDVIKVVEDPNNEGYEICSIEDVFEGDGYAVNSGFIDGLKTEKALEKISDYIEKEGFGKRATTYKLRDQIWSRQRYWGDPIPLLYKEDGTIEADHDLPVELPKLKDFLPEGGKAPLEKVPEWYTTTAKDGTKAKRETDTMPTWAGSNWYYVRYLDPKNEKTFCDKKILDYWMPVDKYFGDAGHTNAHLLYTRFWYKFLYDIGEVPTDEPIKWRMSGGLLLGADNRKMSKSRPEFVVNPKEVVENYGADAARLYLAFIGPYDETYPWNENGIKACYRFTKNVYELKEKVSDVKDPKELLMALNKMIKNVTEMAEDLKMNTSVSELMKFLNKTKEFEAISKESYLKFIMVLAPFAPFVTEDIWQELNDYKKWKNENSIHLQRWPEYDKKFTIDEVITIPIQINGKLRAEIEIARDENDETVKEAALKADGLDKYLNGKEPKKVIYVKNKIVNIVV